MMQSKYKMRFIPVQIASDNEVGQFDRTCK
jgi:hypothetical protein